VVLHSGVWEKTAAFELEASAHVLAYAKNDHLGFTIPYEWEERPHTYTPDYLVRLTNVSLSRTPSAH
jgi:type III restriction enzyme